jgi:capsular polysaccharide biosynthesis protein
MIIKRHLTGIVIIALVTTLAGALYYHLYSSDNPTAATIFINIGSKEKTDAVNASSVYDHLQAADAFTETIMGWFKNKDLLSRIETQAMAEASITAQKQEKQNLLITFRTKNEQTAKKLSMSIQENLLAEIGTYNKSTGSSFQVTIFSATYEQYTSRTLLIIIFLGIILGLSLGFILYFALETITGKIIYSWQPEQILEMKALENLPSKFTKSGQFNYLIALFHNIPYKNFSIIGLGFNPESIVSALSPSLPDHRLTGIEFPEESAEIAGEHGA